MGGAGGHHEGEEGEVGDEGRDQPHPSQRHHEQHQRVEEVKEATKGETTSDAAHPETGEEHGDLGEGHLGDGPQLHQGGSVHASTQALQQVYMYWGIMDIGHNYTWSQRPYSLEMVSTWLMWVLPLGGRNRVSSNNQTFVAKELLKLVPSLLGATNYMSLPYVARGSQNLKHVKHIWEKGPFGSFG